MCFYVYPEALEITKGLRKLREPIVIYKVLDANMFSYLSPEIYQWKYGSNISSQQTTKLKKAPTIISKGFYFYRSFSDADCRRIENNRGYRRIFKCLVDPKDIIIANDYILVATKAILVEEV